MVKFSKEYEAQLVPEWKDAFVDYGQLKKDLKKIKIQILSSSSCITRSSSSSSNNDHTSYMKQHPSFSTTLVSAVQRLSTNFGHQHREHGPIRVHGRFASSSGSNKGGEMYETELLEDIEAAAEFFSRLDLQLNKVNQFYKAKEKEFLERGESLKKQMEILVDLKASMLKPNGEEGVSQSGDSSCSSRRDDDTFFLTSEEEFRTREEETDHQMEGTDQYNEAANKDGMRFTELISRTDDLETSSRRMIKREDSSSSGRVFSCQGKSMRLNIPLTTPSRTFSAMRYLVKEDIVNQSSSNKFDTRKRGTNNKLHVNKSNLHQAEKMIRGAFIELYKGLGYLKTFRNLNMLAFVKILKKFDKVTNKEVMPIYLRVVESSYFNSSDKAMRLSDEVEEIFVKHFAEDNRRKAFKYLKPTHRKESHRITFLIGLFTGCFLALLVGYIIIAHISGKYKQPSDTVYMETVYPVLSMFSLLFLHFFLYGCNIFMWRKARVNYSFIFELAPTKELKYREVFLICAASITAIVGVLLIHLSLLAKGYSSVHVEAIPGYLVLFFLLLLVCPLNIAYKSSRYCFLRVIRNIVFTPLYKVVMLDFFMADQLCSQVPLLRSLEFIGCYYITGSYRTQDYGYCMRTTYYRDLAYAVSFLPYYWRAMQCARRWFDEGQSSHLINLGKYVSAMLAAGAKVAYEKDTSFGYLCLVIALSSAATVYQLYWDYVKDWGLLQFHSRNPWLRNELMVRHKSIYYFSMVLNLVLRLAWLQTVLHPNIGNIDYRLMGLFLAALEVIRRGQWNFYRLENEHLNNAGKFRAVKNVPLPFHEVEDEN